MEVIMLRAIDTIWPIRVVFLGITTALLLSTSALATEQRPKELRGEITAITGDRIHISLSQQEWLPLAGMAVEFGAEMAGMWVPLKGKGKFVIIQVNADSCIAKAVGKEEHGKPADGMAAVIKTLFPKPQSRISYVGLENDPRFKSILKMAESGHRRSLCTVAMGYQGRGDHDNALVWWERASNGAKDRYSISTSAISRANILHLRSEFQKALAVLKDAASRTEARVDEMVFEAYDDLNSGVKFHVDVLEKLGSFYRKDNIGESRRWFRAAAKVMAACATNGAPRPGQPGYSTDYQDLLNRLGRIYLDYLEDEEAAVPWLQSSARTGDKYAQKRLTDMGRTW